MFAFLLSFANANIIDRIAHLKVLEHPATSLKVTWDDCGSGAHGVVNALTPGAMTLGTDTEMTGTGSVDEAVNGGTFTISVKAGGGIVNSKFNGNVCDPSTFTIKALGMTMGTLSWEGIACPLAAGPTTVSMKVDLSASIPASMAAATIHLAASDSSGASLLCLDVNTST